MFENIKENERMIKGAYRKLKSYYYYNKNFILMRKKIADFEKDHSLMDRTFSMLAFCLCHPRSNITKAYKTELLSAINFYVIPKKFEAEPISGSHPIANTLPRDKRMKTVNFFIDAPIEVFIFDTLWTVFLGKMDKDKKILSFDVYGNTINSSALFMDDDINFDNLVLFNRYFNKYTDWRNKAFQKLEYNYNRKKDSLLISLDIQSYFYSVAFSFDRLNAYFNNHELLDKIKPLTSFIRQVYEAYFEKIAPYRKDIVELKKHQYILPIGLFSAMVLGNIYLAKFDEKMHAQKGVLYYGRYVDDILLVIDKTIAQTQTIAEVMKNIFIDTGIFESRDKKYIIRGYPGLLVQSEKIKIIYIDHNESKAIIDIYNDTIRIIPSQLDPGPESFFNLTSFDETAYTIENFTKENKLRDIGLIGVDTFKVGRFFSSLVHGYAHINISGEESKKAIDQNISQIEKFFTGSQGVEFYADWLNYMYFLVITQRWKQLRTFCSETKKRINQIKHTSLDRKMYDRTASINKKAKETLLLHLDICKYLALALDKDTVIKYFKADKDTINSYVDSNMFDHSLVAFPLANYLYYDKDVSYIKMELKDMGNYPEKMETSFKFMWSPRFIHYDELLLLLFYHYHRCNNNRVTFNYVKDGLVEKFMDINSMKYQPFNISASEPIIIEDYSLRRIQIPPEHMKTPQTVNIAVGSLNISLQKCLAGCKRWANITLQEKEAINNILRESHRCFSSKDRGTMLLVLPELCFPIYWIGELIRFAKRAQIAVVAGLQYLGDNKNGMYNYIATILPFTSGKKHYKNAFVHIREKNDYSPIEFEELAKIGHLCNNREVAEYQVFSWKGINISPLICFELTDVMVRALLKGRCDIIAASVFNPDTTYFSNIIDSTVRDLHAFVIQANTSFFGDSRVTGPYDRDSKDVFKIKGGDNDHVVIGTIEFKRVKDYEDSYAENIKAKLNAIMKQLGKKHPTYPAKDKSKPNIKPLSARYKIKKTGGYGDTDT